MRNSVRRGLLAAVASAMLVRPMVGLADVCPIDGGQAMDEAKSVGLTFDISKSDGVGQCDRGSDDPWFLASADENSSLTCKVILFGGGPGLLGEWRFVRVELTSDATDRVVPARGSAGLKIQFQLNAPAGEERQAFLKNLVLSGPDCRKWHDAFE
jgi:hypothetical protein